MTKPMPLLEFYREFMPDEFYKPHSLSDLRAIKQLERTCLEGGKFTSIGKRGSGNTTRAIGAMIWVAIHGIQERVHYQGYSEYSVGEMLTDIRDSIIRIDGQGIRISDTTNYSFRIGRCETTCLITGSSKAPGDRNFDGIHILDI